MWFKRHKKEAATIGEHLHHQIFTALKEDAEQADKKLNGVFLVGYLYSFVSTAFEVQGVPASKADDYLKFILDGVLPGKLWKRLSQAVGLMEFKSRISAEKGEQYAPELYTMGKRAGEIDGLNLLSVDESDKTYSLLTYLLEKEERSLY